MAYTKEIGPWHYERTELGNVHVRNSAGSLVFDVQKADIPDVLDFLIKCFLLNGPAVKAVLFLYDRIVEYTVKDE